MFALDRLLREAQVLEIVCQLMEERLEAAGSAAGGKGSKGLRRRDLPAGCVA